MKRIIALVAVLISATLFKCSDTKPTVDESANELTYFDNSGRDDVYTGGVRMIPISTPKGTFNVWTKRIGNNPTIKLLTLHGGPGATHELYECFDSYLPAAGIEYYYYDQLGSYYSDQPSDTSLWDLPRFVEEVEQVRKALGLDNTNFYLLGQSWGGILAMEYARKYQDNLKGLIISNMVPSIPDYMKYADEVLGPQLPPEVLKEIRELEEKEDYSNPRYMELITEYYYTEHVLRKPLDKWPEPINRCFKHLNPEVYVYMQGPSEFGVRGDATLKDWEFKEHLKDIRVPTLTIGGQYDTMDPEVMKWMSTEVQKGRYLHCPNSGHFSQFDDQEIYVNGVIDFLKDVDSGKF